MKKILFILFFIITIFGFANQTYDDTKFRQDLVNWATSKVGAKYDMKDRWGANTYDCSSLVSRGLGAVGMTSISGKKSDYGTTAKGLYQASGKIISKTDYNSLKPGDIVHFSASSAGTTGHVGIVIANLGNGKVEIVDARGKDYGVVRRVIDLSKNSKYLGATSATQVLINNGYTPVNADGTVVAPEGSAVGSPEDTNQYYDSGFIIDFDKVVSMYADVFVKGVKNLETTLIVIMTFIFSITFMHKVIKSGFASVDIVIQDMIFDLLKFVFFILIIKNYTVINNVTLKTCFTVAKAFGSDLEDYKVLNQLMTSYIENIEFLIKAFSSESSNFLVKFIQNGLSMFNPFKMTVIMGCILYITTLFGYIVFQITRVIMTFVIGNAIAVLLLPFWFSDSLKEYIPNPITIYCKSTLQMFGSIIFISISLRIVEGVTIKGNTNFDYLLVFTYIIYFTIVAFILKKILKVITQMI